VNLLLSTCHKTNCDLILSLLQSIVDHRDSNNVGAGWSRPSTGGLRLPFSFGSRIIEVPPSSSESKSWGCRHSVISIFFCKNLKSESFHQRSCFHTNVASQNNLTMFARAASRFVSVARSRVVSSTASRSLSVSLWPSLLELNFIGGRKILRRNGVGCPLVYIADLIFSFSDCSC